MADVSLRLPIDESWTEVTAALSLTDGSRYLVDVADAPPRAVVYQADTDTATDEPTVAGHPWVPHGQGFGVDSRTFTKRSGVFWWVRLSGGSAELMLSPLG